MDPYNDHNIEQCYRLLALCARSEGHSLMDEQLANQINSFTAWDVLPVQAELHGMGPLLWHHLKRTGLSIPDEQRRMLQGLYLRHHHLNQFHTTTLLEISTLFQECRIKFLVLKGLAIAYTCYSDPALRPVSDIDLLLHSEDVVPALKILDNADYKVNFPDSTLPRLPRELIVDSATRDGLHTHIEIHHHDPGARSPLDNTPDREFEEFEATPVSEKINGGIIFVPDPMEHFYYLWKHLVRHLFLATTGRPLPLKWSTDIVSFVERYADNIDWPDLQKRYPDILRRLDLFYSLTPLPERFKGIIPVREISSPSGLNQYPSGWPQKPLSDSKRVGLWRFLRQTLTSPSNWWLCLQYGIAEKSVFWYGQVVYRLRIIELVFKRLLRITGT